MSTLPELWSKETVAEFLLNKAMGEEDYRDTIAEVLGRGIDPKA